jgi:L-lactate dehydrogenase complex protein LldF
MSLGSLAARKCSSENGMIRRLPPPLQGWTQSRDLDPLAKETFMERWRRKKSNE